jgi:hypothetical protein
MFVIWRYRKLMRTRMHALSLWRKRQERKAALIFAPYWCKNTLGLSNLMG